jgi:lipopolysaccharide transport system ATP-binding protein
MAIAFRQVCFPPLVDLNVSAADGAAIGIVGEDGAGKRALLRLAAGLEKPVAGEVSARGSSRLLDPADNLDLSPVDTLLLEHTLGQRDALVRAQAVMTLEHLRRSGSTILMVSHEEELLRAACDEIWWLDRGKLAARGDPGEVLEKYRGHIARRLRAWGESTSSPLAPSLRRGDGRAELLNVETLDSRGRPTMVWQSGEAAVVRITARYRQPVADPVIGIMIRTRIGFEVYGTNTELEQLKLGPCAAGETLRVVFSFRCDLCPQEYTLTAASHDPDGVWHDWLEDAVAVAVADSRYTAGVANLRARVSVEKARGS